MVRQKLVRFSIIVHIIIVAIVLTIVIYIFQVYTIIAPSSQSTRAHTESHSKFKDTKPSLHHHHSHKQNTIAARKYKNYIANYESKLSKIKVSPSTGNVLTHLDSIYFEMFNHDLPFSKRFDWIQNKTLLTKLDNITHYSRYDFQRTYNLDWKDNYFALHSLATIFHLNDSNKTRHNNSDTDYNMTHNFLTIDHDSHDHITRSISRNDVNINPKKQSHRRKFACDYKSPVFGIGMQKTGTLTLNNALHLLGFSFSRDERRISNRHWGLDPFYYDNFVSFLTRDEIIAIVLWHPFIRDFIHYIFTNQSIKAYSSGDMPWAVFYPIYDFFMSSISSPRPIAGSRSNIKSNKFIITIKDSNRDLANSHIKALALVRHNMEVNRYNNKDHKVWKTLNDVTWPGDGSGSTITGFDLAYLLAWRYDRHTNEVFKYFFNIDLEYNFDMFNIYDKLGYNYNYNYINGQMQDSNYNRNYNINNNISLWNERLLVINWSQLIRDSNDTTTMFERSGIYDFLGCKYTIWDNENGKYKYNKKKFAKYDNNWPKNEHKTSVIKDIIPKEIKRLNWKLYWYERYKKKNTGTRFAQTEDKILRPQSKGKNTISNVKLNLDFEKLDLIPRIVKSRKMLRLEFIQQDWISPF